jgi:hypothetical protein
MKYGYLILITVAAFSVQAQPVTFTQTFGGALNDFAFSVQQTHDDGYIIAGQTESFGKGGQGMPDLWIIKTDKKGSKEWEKTYGGNEGDGGYCIRQTADQGYIVSGSTSSYGKGYPSMWILKLNSKGDTAWSKIFEGSMVSSAQSVCLTSDGGYIVAGKGKENVLKLDSKGNKEWGKRFGWLFYSAEQTADGGFILAGDSIYQQLNWDYLPSLYVIKLDRNGEKIWSNPLGSKFLGRSSSICQVKEGGFIFAGDSIALKQEGDHSHFSMVCKLDEQGKKEWVYFGNEYSEFQSVQQTSDGGFIAAGNTTDDQHGLDLLLVKLDRNGRKIWSRTFGKSLTWEYASTVRQVRDGGYIVAGQTESFGSGKYDSWLLKLDENGNGPVTGISFPKAQINFKLLPNFPNPFSKSTTIPFQLEKPGFVTLKILNQSGQVLQVLVSEKYPSGEFSLHYSPEGLSDGIYFIQLHVNGSAQAQTFIIKK